MSADKNYIKLAQLYNIIKSNQPKLDSIEIILKTGFNINYGLPVKSLLSKQKPEFTGYTLLHFIVQYKLHKFVDFLLQEHADITCTSQNGFTPLRLAFELMKNFTMDKDLKNNKLHNTIIYNLLSAHINFNIKINPKCRNNISHFHIACMIDSKFAEFFIEAGVDINETVDIDSPIFPGFSPLHFAVRYGHLELVKKLLECGANVNQPDDHNKTPLRLLVDYNMEINEVQKYVSEETKFQQKIKVLEKNDKIMKTLMTVAGPNFFNSVDEIGFTYFHASCTRQNQDYVEKLLKLDAKINEPVKFDAPLWPGYTPLHFAARCNLQTVILLLKKGANLVAKDANGMTALDLCAERYTSIELTRILRTVSVGYIQFEKNATLADVISSMCSVHAFEAFLSTVKINSRVPFNSPIWPGYTLLHLIVLVCTKNKQYFNSKYFIFKNISWDQNVFTDLCYSTNMSKMCLEKNKNLLFEMANGMTPLRLAYYLNRGANFYNELTAYVTDISSTIGQENLVYLVASSSPSVIKELLKDTANLYWTLQRDEVWYCNDNHGGPQKIINLKAGLTLLHVAALIEANTIICECSKIEVNISICDTDGLTPTHLGFVHSKSQKTIFNLLSIPSAHKINSATKSNLSHFHIACYVGNEKAAKELLQVTTNINEQIICDPLDPYFNILSKYNGYTPLHFAVQFERVKIVSLLIKNNADVLKKNAKGLSPLHLALQNQKSGIIMRQIVKVVIEEKNFQDDFGITKLHLAYFINNKNLIKNLLKAGEDVNSQINFDSPIFPGDTPHHLLVRKFLQDRTVPELLSQHGIDFTLKNSDNLSSLLLLHGNKFPFFEREVNPNILLTQDINKFCSINYINNEGLSHLHISCYLNQLTYVEKFLQNGANVNESIDHFSNYKAGNTLLHTAVEAKNYQLIVLLLRYGADISAEDIDGLTPLHHVVLKNPFSFVRDSIEDMISQSSTKFDLFNSNALGKSVFEKFYKCWKNDISSLSWILDKHDGDINLLRQPFDKFLKILGKKNSKNEIIQLVLKKRVDLSAQDTNGHNALFKVLSVFNVYHDSKGSISLCNKWFLNNVEALVNAGCDLDHKDFNGKTALHQTIVYSAIMGTSVLLEIGADINICDDEGYPPCKYLKADTNIFVKLMVKKHVLKMSTAGLYLNESNRKFLMSFSKNDISESKTLVLSKLSQMEKESVDEQLTVRDLLTEWLVLTFPKFQKLKRLTIIDFLGSDELLKRYPDWRGLFMLQRRKLLARIDLLKPAAEICQAITGLPLLCADMIVENLSIEELKNLIEI